MQKAGEQLHFHSQSNFILEDVILIHFTGKKLNRVVQHLLWADQQQTQASDTNNQKTVDKQKGYHHTDRN